MAELQHGAALAGYRIEALIGQGSTGSVYSAQEVALRRRVALKVLLPEFARDERFRERFVRESRLAASLEHPHIVPIHAVGESDGLLYLAMRYVGNRDLAGLLERVGRLDPDRVLRICGHVGSALDEAHAHDLVHRDVKPGNILLAREGDDDFAYLCDFGLAKHSSTVTSLTGSRAVVGTVDYLSPEQIEGLPVDGRTDVYALGCVLFQCLAGEPPYARGNELAAILAHRTAPPPSLSERRPELPEALDQVIARAMAKDREARYTTCAELLADARAALRGQAPAPAPPPPSGAAALHTFLFADVRGYTAYTREHGDEAGADLAGRFAQIVEALAPEHAGTLLELRGDEALVVFDSPRAALRFAVALQRRIRDGELPRGVGIGLDAGEAVAVEGGYRGGALNRAARLCSLAHAGDVLASDGVIHLAGSFGDVHYGLRRLERLKGFAQPVGVVEIHPGETAPRRELRRRAGRVVRGRRPRVRLAVVLAAVAAAAALAVVLAGGGGGGAPPFQADSIAMINARTGAPIGTAAPGLHICVFGTAGHDLWACDADQSILLRVDQRRRSVVDQVPLPTYHGSFTIGFGEIWVGDVATPTVRTVNPRYRTSSSPIRLPHVPAVSPDGTPENVGSLVTTRDAVWAAYGFPKRIARIDPRTRRVTFDTAMRQDCPCEVQLAVGGGKLWAVGGGGERIYRLDPRSGRTLASGSLHHGQVAGAAVAGGYLWVGLTEDGAVWKIDESGSAIDKVATGAGVSDVRAADGYVWVANADAGTVTRVDPRTNATRTYRVGHRPLAVAELGGTLFVGLAQSPEEAAAGVTGPKVLRASSMDYAYANDPVGIFGPGDLQVVGAAGAGLMAVRPGSGGTSHVEPELARAAPAVSADGRTSTFQLRSGLRFSSKEPVTAGAVISSIERAVSPKLVIRYCHDLVLHDLAGQAAYDAGRADHIAGLRAQGDRVSITLAAPSPTLPARLANPCLSIVPPGTPTIPVGLSHPVPSAGPYLMESVVEGRQAVLRRNPQYHGPRPQPLEAMILRGGSDVAKAGALVERGAADYTTSSGGPPSPDFAPGGRYERTYSKPGGRARFVVPPSPLTQVLIFNTRHGVFRSAALRRAVNLALDRRTLGPPGTTPRSLLIPPGFPGHRARGAYGPAPELRRAQRLARGHGGSAVIVAMAPQQGVDPVASQVRDTLARLGVTVRLRQVADPAGVVADPSQHVDAVVTRWAADYVDPFDAVNVLLEPGARVGGFPDFFGDPAWVRRMRQAAAAPLNRRDSVYARLDADLARGPAPLAVLFGALGAGQLFSSRVGCQRFTSYNGLVDLASLCIR